MNKKEVSLDLKNVPCPLNVVKCKLALEKISKTEVLVLDLDRGEPEIMVKKELEGLRFSYKIRHEDPTWIRLEIEHASK